MFRTTKDEDDGGNFKYFPYKAKTYVYPDTMDNIIKQWHSIDAVWNEMERLSSTIRSKKYDRVAILRSDVLYLEPINVYDQQHRYNTAVIPDFANHPVSDRMFIGPYNAVKIWATQRFALVEHQVQTYKPKGFGVHYERMMSHSILPKMEEE